MLFELETIWLGYAIELNMYTVYVIEYREEETWIYV